MDKKDKKEMKQYLKSKNKFSDFPLKNEVLTLLRDQGFLKPTQVQA